MVKTHVGRTMSGKGFGPSSTKRKKSSRGEESPSSDLPIVNVWFQEKDSDVPAQTNAQVGGTIILEAKQNFMAKKNAFPP